MNERIIFKLLDFIENISGGKLYTDRYHFDILNTLSNMIPILGIIDKTNIIIVEDNLSVLKDIEPDSYVILYNMSTYLENNKFNFYDSSDKLISKEMFESVISEAHEDNISKILNSYEVDKNKSIEDWFNNI